MNINEMLAQEWTTLQNNHEQYERSGLLVKLVAVALAAMGIALGQDTLFVAALVALLWIQEGILRTFQARLGERILRIEVLIRRGSAGTNAVALQPLAESAAFQLHSEWMAARTQGVSRLTEYAGSACRPTVAFPYAVILLGFMIAQVG